MLNCWYSDMRMRYCGGTPGGCGTSRPTGPGSPHWRGLYRALTHNAVLVMMLPFAAAAWLRAVTGRTGAVASPRWLCYAAMAVLAMWTVIRNLPPVRGILTAQ
jgi:hypothetical protein